MSVNGAHMVRVGKVGRGVFGLVFRRRRRVIAVTAGGVHFRIIAVGKSEGQEPEQEEEGSSG